MVVENLSNFRGQGPIPKERFCEEHKKDAQLIGWDSDGFGVYECSGPPSHGLLEDGGTMPIESARVFAKL